MCHSSSRVPRCPFFRPNWHTQNPIPSTRTLQAVRKTSQVFFPLLLPLPWVGRSFSLVPPPFRFLLAPPLPIFAEIGARIASAGAELLLGPARTGEWKETGAVQLWVFFSTQSAARSRRRRDRRNSRYFFVSSRQLLQLSNPSLPRRAIGLIPCLSGCKRGFGCARGLGAGPEEGKRLRERAALRSLCRPRGTICEKKRERAEAEAFFITLVCSLLVQKHKRNACLLSRFAASIVPN